MRVYGSVIRIGNSINLHDYYFVVFVSNCKSMLLLKLSKGWHHLVYELLIVR